MEPLKISFWVSGGFVPPPYPLHLDAVLAYVETRAALRDLNESNSSVAALRALAEHLPLGRHEQDGGWCWMASALMPNGSVRNAGRFFTQRRDKEDYAARVARQELRHGRHPIGAPMAPYQYAIDTQRGVYRNLLGFYPVQHGMPDANTPDHLLLEAWCVGHRARIESLLQDGWLTHLGARRRSGHGRIERISVARDETALEMWKQRVRPWPMLPEDVAIQAAAQPPYWAAELRGRAYCPTTLA
ncbi:MAG: type IV CRISPR-associated protein Csf3 [Burkholderiales bacterium]|nr:MAG: type IV CRISPR-associated protein Csf3 [Burkholderiales bacterium]